MRGRHVLLLDLDLRKPALHKIFGLRTAAKNGIGQYLQAEKDAEPPLIFSEKYGISLALPRLPRTRSAFCTVKS